MKKIILLLLVISSFTNIFCQAPEKFSFQGELRDSNGELISSQNVGVKIALIEGSQSGNVVFEELHTVLTSVNGRFNLIIGDGIQIGAGSLSNIDFGSNNYYVNVAIDENGGTNFTDISQSQLLSVPYALYAKNSGSAGGSQNLSFNNSTGELTISGGNTVTIPTSQSGDNWGNQVVEIDANILEGNGTSQSPLSIKPSPDSYKVLRTNSTGGVYWSSFGGYAVYSSSTINAIPTSWQLEDRVANSQFGDLCSGTCNLILQVYSDVSRTMYFRRPNDPNPVTSIYDIPAGRAVVVYVELMNGEFEYYSNTSNGQIKIKYAGFFN